MPKDPEDFSAKPRKKFHAIIQNILSGKNPEREDALKYWRRKHQEAIKELRGEGVRFRSKERFKSFKKIDEMLQPLYEAIKQKDANAIQAQENAINDYAARLKKRSQTMSPAGRQVILECTIVNLYYLAIAKIMIALLLPLASPWPQTEDDI